MCFGWVLVKPGCGSQEYLEIQSSGPLWSAGWWCYRDRDKAALGTGWTGADGCVWQHMPAAAPEPPWDGRSGESASETLGAMCPAKTFF